MKILMEKNVPVVNQQSSSPDSLPNDLFDILSSCLFSNMMSMTESNKQIPAKDDSKINSSDNHESPEPLEAAVSDPIGSLQSILSDVLMQAVNYQADRVKQGEGDGSHNTDVKNKPEAHKDQIIQSGTPVTKTITDDIIRQNLRKAEQVPAQMITDNQPTREDKSSIKYAKDIEHIEDIKNIKDTFLSKINRDTEPVNNSKQKLTPTVKVQEDMSPNFMKTSFVNSVNHTPIGGIDNDTSGTQRKMIESSVQNWMNDINNSKISVEAMMQAAQQTYSQTVSSQAQPSLVLDKPIEQPRGQEMNLSLDQMQPDPLQPGVYQVKIKVNPAELGPIHASIKITNNKVDVHISTTNPHAEQVVRAHLTNLATQFSETSLKLDNVTVFQQTDFSFNQQEQSTSRAPNGIEEEVIKAVDGKQVADKTKKNEDRIIDAYI